ncbi:MAG: indole-3-glycerol phosphate synthase TrpC, partial [Pyrinomonadaceae bacterium]
QPLTVQRETAFATLKGKPRHALSAALSRADRTNVIAEIKRASPSRGDLRRGLDPASIARDYEAHGAAAISILTEEDFFCGSLDDLRAVKAVVGVPVLRKDFIFDEWQVYESAAAGADALLLIVAALEDEQLARLKRITEEDLGMDALVEVHDGEELRRAVGCGATLVGVNNRNLRTFEVSLEISVEMSKEIHEGLRFVSESGLRTAGDVTRLSALGYAGFLVGETLLRAESPGAALAALLNRRE